MKLKLFFYFISSIIFCSFGLNYSALAQLNTPVVVPELTASSCKEQEGCKSVDEYVAEIQEIIEALQKYSGELKDLYNLREDSLKAVYASSDSKEVKAALEKQILEELAVIQAHIRLADENIAFLDAAKRGFFVVGGECYFSDLKRVQIGNEYCCCETTNLALTKEMLRVRLIIYAYHTTGIPSSSKWPLIEFPLGIGLPPAPMLPPPPGSIPPP